LIYINKPLCVLRYKSRMTGEEKRQYRVGVFFVGLLLRPLAVMMLPMTWLAQDGSERSQAIHAPYTSSSVATATN
jgi:hypothetical protein